MDEHDDIADEGVGQEHHVPPDLLELHLALEDAGVTAEEFKEETQ